MKEEVRVENIRILRELLEKIPVAMLTTLQTRDASLRSRPMIAQTFDFNGELWFFSKFNSGKIDEIRAGSQVNLAYADHNNGLYISVSGVATIDQTQQSLQSKWSELYQTWFPRGLDEPELALLRVAVQSAEIWDESTHRNGEFLKFT